MTQRGLISPPRAHSGPNKPASPRRPNYHMSPPRRPMAAPNPYDLQNRKKLGYNNNNFSTKTTSKIISSRPAPQTLRIGVQVELPRGATPISENTTSKPKRPIGSDSPATNAIARNANLMPQKLLHSPNHSSPIHGSGRRQDMNNIADNGHPQLNNHLQKLSTHGDAGRETPIYVGEIPIYGGEEEIVLHSKCSSQSNVPRIFQIYKEIASHRQGNSSVISYFTSLKKLWDELETYNDLSQFCSSGATEKLCEHVDREKVMQFLVGLNVPYSTICHQILLIRPFPTMEKAYSIIIREEKRGNSFSKSNAK